MVVPKPLSQIPGSAPPTLRIHSRRGSLKSVPETVDIGTSPRAGPGSLKAVYQLVFHSLVLMSWGSRKVAKDFDRIPLRELTTAYVENLGRLFAQEPDLRFRPPRHLLRAFGVTDERLAEDGPGAISVEAAERAARRERVEVKAL